MKKYRVNVNGTAYEVEIEEMTDASAAAPVAAAPAAAPAPAAEPKAAPSGEAGAVKVTSPMPGTILKVDVTAGQAVKKGDTICILEAMKMENAIPAPQDGTIASVNVAKGASVNTGDLLASLD